MVATPDEGNNKGESMSVRLWIIKKLIPDYRTKKGQDLAFKLWNWTTPHLEHMGYSWTLHAETKPAPRGNKE